MRMGVLVVGLCMVSSWGEPACGRRHKGVKVIPVAVSRHRVTRRGLVCVRRGRGVNMVPGNDSRFPARPPRCYLTGPRVPARLPKRAKGSPDCCGTVVAAFLAARRDAGGGSARGRL